MLDRLKRRLRKSPSPAAAAYGALMRDVQQNLTLHSGVFIRAVLVVMVPTTLMSAAAGPTNENAISVYVGVATIVMNGALAWMATQVVNGRDIDVKSAYYFGSPAVRILLLSWWLVLGLLPVGLALLIYSVATAAGVDVLSQIALMALVLLVAVPSLIYQATVAFSMYALLDRTDMGPIEALRQSRKVARGHLGLVIRRLIGLILTLFVIVAPPSLAFGLIAAYAEIGWLLYFLQILVTVAALPVLHLYMARLYKELKA